MRQMVVATLGVAAIAAPAQTPAAKPDEKTLSDASDVEKVAAQQSGRDAMKALSLVIGAASIIAASISAFAQAPTTKAIPVTIDNFARAESDLYMNNSVKEGSLGKLFHRREPASIDNQTVIRLNRDTLYSSGVFDFDAGPVTVTMPEAGKHFMSLQVINEDHYVPGVYYGAGAYTFTRENVGTRYALIGIRTLVDPNDPKDLKQVHALQDSIKVEQENSGKFEIPNWDQKSQKDIRGALLVLNNYTGGFAHAFGTKDDVDPVRHLIGTAAGWGGNPDKDATYLSITPTENDGSIIYKLHVQDVPVKCL